MNPESRLAEIVAALEGAGIPCLVMGGHAVRFYGLSTNTFDFDLHLAPESRAARSQGMNPQKSRRPRLRTRRPSAASPRRRRPCCRFEVPELEQMTLTTDGQGLAVRRETHCPHLVEAAQYINQFPGLCVPESHGLIPSTARQCVTVR